MMSPWSRRSAAPVPAATFRNPAARLAPAALALVTAALAACSDSSGPDPDPVPTVATVEVAAAATSVEVGGLLQLTATSRDAQGNVLSGRTVTWSSTNQGVATVDASGLVNGVAAGAATINATVDGKSGSFQITVTAPPLVILSTVTPNPLVPGQSATLTGSGFSTVPSANTVDIGGTRATVTAASGTTLTVTVPASLCTPPGSVQVTVTVGGRVSNPIQQPAQSGGTAVTAGLGRMQYLQSGFCLQFGTSAASESYLVGVQNYSENVTLVTPVTVAMSALAAAPALAADPGIAPFGAALERPAAEDPARALRWARHRAAEFALRTAERSAAMPPFSATAAADAAAMIPAVVNVGDSVLIRVPDRTNLCLGYVEITTVVKAIGTKSIWLEDVANPAGGFTANDYLYLTNLFDTRIHATQLEYFGTPSDLDGNGRIVIVVTKEINKSNLLGFTTNADLRPRSLSCPSSDFGEIYYGRAPDPNGAAGDAYTLADALLDAPQLLAHEGTHIAQFSIRGVNPLPSRWEMEGQATFAEEVVGHAVTSRVPGQNYGFDVAFNCVPGSSPCADAGGSAWYIGGFVDMALYYGFDPDAANPQQTPVSGAPEQCSWLDLDTNGNTGPCFSGREVYGVPWLLLRYISDQYGSRFAGGEKELHRQLIAGTLSGFANLQALTGRPAEEVLAEWAASLYVDDRVAGADARLTLPSWNLFGIEQRLVTPARLRPRTRTFSTFSDPVDVRAGSTAYFLVSGARGASALRMRGAGETTLPANMRVWVVRLQ